MDDLTRGQICHIVSNTWMDTPHSILNSLVGSKDPTHAESEILWKSIPDSQVWNPTVWHTLSFKNGLINFIIFKIIQDTHVFSFLCI
jgi:hypothetical protein